MGRRALVDPKTVLAGEMLDASFARVRSSMASFNFDKASLRPFGRWDFGSIVETCGSCKEMVWAMVVREKPNSNPDGRSFDVARAHLVGGVQRLMNRIRLGVVWSMIQFQSEPPRSTDHPPYHQPLSWGDAELGAPNCPGRVSVSQLNLPSRNLPSPNRKI